MFIDPFPTDGIPFYKNRLVCVTGASGLIGSYVVKLLKDSGAKVRALCNRRPANELTKLADAVAMDFDLLLGPEVCFSAVRGCDAVINCAGITGGIGLAHKSPLGYVGPATAMAINMLQATVDANIPLFGFLSSTTVYAPSLTPVIEEDVEKPDPIYPLYRGIGESKRFLEKLCRYYHDKTGVACGIVRPSGAYGRFDNFDQGTSHVIPGMIDRALKLAPDENFEVWGDGGDTRDFVHAQDVAECFLLTCARAKDADPINAASGKPITTGELAQAVLDAAGSTAAVKFRPDKPTALRSRTVNVDKAQRLLDWKATITIEDGLKDTISWRRAQ